MLLPVRARIAATGLAVAALVAALFGCWPERTPIRTHIYYCWNPEVGLALPCRYVKADRDI